MKVGLIARSEDRGLGNLTFEWAQHMHPDRVLVIVPNHPIIQRAERYPGATFMRWDHHGSGELEEEAVREWLRGLDVVYSAETFYDWRICDWARDLGVRTVCHAMPEYYRHGAPNPPAPPDVWWTPTRWRLNTLPRSTRVVPVPIATERFTRNSERVVRNSPPRWLHVAGARAAADRNGTRIVLGALMHMIRDHRVRICTQDRSLARFRSRDRVAVSVMASPAAEYWELYGDADALVLPRRYAGLSLPVLEAMGAGLAVVMTDVEPQRSEWPIIGLDATIRGSINTASGPIRLAEVPVRTLAAKLDWLADHPDEIASARHRSSSFASAHSWSNLADVHLDELVRALES